MTNQIIAAISAIAFACVFCDFSYGSEWDLLKLQKPKSYICARVAGPIQIDGKLDEPAWNKAPWTEDFADIEGSTKPKPRFRTRAKMLWDADYFYIVAELEEPHVSGTITQRDAVIFQDNDFEVFIDPNGDNHEYYELELNALNTAWDLFLKLPYKDGGKALDSWDIAGLKSAVHIQGTLNDSKDADRGWTVELALPWKALGEYAHRPAPPKEGDQWRVNFSRVEWEYKVVEGKYRKTPNKKEDNWVWSPQGIIDMHRPERWGYVQFTALDPIEIKFQPDASAPAREALMEIYYAQKEFHKARKRWAQLRELPLDDLPRVPAIQRVEIGLTDAGFEASVELRLPSGQTERWRLTQDSRLWSDVRSRP